MVVTVLKNNCLRAHLRREAPPSQAPGHPGLLPGAAGQGGMSLVEVMMAMLILSFVSLALMQTVLFNIQVNTRAQLREIGTNLASEKLDEVRNIPFASLTGINGSKKTYDRLFRNMTVKYGITNTVTVLVTDETLRVDVKVDWTFSSEPLSTTVSTIRSKQ